MEIQEDEIDNLAFDILKQSNSLGVFPTPINKIIDHVELRLDEKTDLKKIPKNYLSKGGEKLKSVVRKLRGVLDRKEKIIYVDPNQHVSRKRFVKLHEVGHEVIPWQRKLYEMYEEDELTISFNNNEEFEVEANYFASGTLFQLNRFEEKSLELPLEIGSPMHLAKVFGGSIHASLRRYVTRSKKRCALLVLENPSADNMSCSIRDFFCSSPFRKEFGEIQWPDKVGFEYDFVQDYVIRNRRFHKDGIFSLNQKKLLNTILSYHYFYNSYNAFVLFFPKGEKQNIKTKIVMSSK